MCDFDFGKVGKKNQLHLSDAVAWVTEVCFKMIIGNYVFRFLSLSNSRLVFCRIGYGTPFFLVFALKLYVVFQEERSAFFV